ncbi:MAG: hypothetical protein Q9159_005646 [Coniocarpon cinnabarinum]
MPTQNTALSATRRVTPIFSFPTKATGNAVEQEWYACTKQPQNVDKADDQDPPSMMLVGKYARVEEENDEFDSRERRMEKAFANVVAMQKYRDGVMQAGDIFTKT